MFRAFVIMIMLMSAPAVRGAPVLVNVPPEHEELIASIRALLPRAVFVECLLVREQDATFIGYGFDMGTGAWYEATQFGGHARVREGQVVTARGSHEHERLRFTHSDANHTIERRVFPFIWLDQITRHPESITSIRRSEDGFVLEFAAVRGDPRLAGRDGDTLWTYRLTLNREGHLVRKERLDASTREEIRILGTVDGVPISISSTLERGEWAIKDARVRPQRAAVDWAAMAQERFDTVRSLVGEERAGRAAASPPVHAAPGTAAVGDGAEADGVARLSRPLRFAGVFMIVLAAALWYRSKRA